MGCGRCRVGVVGRGGCVVGVGVVDVVGPVGVVGEEW